VKNDYCFCCTHTGQPGWGIAWYINGTLIPALEVQRGRTYTFIIEGGTDANNLAQFHPFYITDSVNGGRIRNSPEEVVVRHIFLSTSEHGIQFEIT